MAVALPHASLAAQLPEDNNESLEMATSSLTASPDSRDDVPMPMPGDFDVVQHYADLLQKDEVGCEALFIDAFWLYSYSTSRSTSLCQSLLSSH